MGVHAVWDAARTGNAKELRGALARAVNSRGIGARCDNHGWTILHHAVVSGSLACVTLVVNRLRPDTKRKCHEGLTPLARACQRSAPEKIVSYLLQIAKSTVNLGDNEDVTPLHYAVSQNRLDVVEVLVANGANVNAVDYASETPTDTTAFDTGNVEILIHLLFIGKASLPNLHIFGARAHYEVDKKIAIFKILYNYKHPDHEYRQRYSLMDVVVPALLSHRSQSLVPFFIEAEVKFEKNEVLKSLYKRLSKQDYGLLPLFVWCVANRNSNPQEDPISRWPTEFIIEDLCCGILNLAFAAITGDDEELMEHTLPYLRVVKPILVTANIITSFFFNLQSKLKELWYTDTFVNHWDNILKPRYQRVVDCLIPFEEGCVDELVKELLFIIPKYETSLLKLILPFIEYCSFLFMKSGGAKYFWCRMPDSVVSILYQHIGTMETGNCLFESTYFTLKRLARDAIRKEVLLGIANIKMKNCSMKFKNKIESLELPNELKLYLRYRDEETVTSLFKDSVNCEQYYMQE